MGNYEYHLPDHRIEYGIMIPVEAPKTDAQSQRALNKNRAAAIADNLQLSAIGTITLSERDGTLWVVDGQHRQQALRLAGEKNMPCEIHYGLTRQQEAVLFLIKNRESARPGAYDEYKIGLTGGVQPTLREWWFSLQPWGSGMLPPYSPPPLPLPSNVYQLPRAA